MELRMYGADVTPGVKAALRTLWETTFHDTEAYLDFYFNEIAGKNRIFTLWDGAVLVSMLFADPYQLSVAGTTADSYYIVGVATDPLYRRQGAMRTVMDTALDTFRKEGISFVYLMPAKEEYYTPFGFQTISSQPRLRLSAAQDTPLTIRNGTYRDTLLSAASIPGLTVRQLSGGIEDSALLHSAAAFANKFLARSHRVFTLRSAAYYRRLAAELAAEDGALLLFYEGPGLAAVLVYEKESGVPQILEVLADDTERILACAADYLAGDGRPVWESAEQAVIMIKFLDSTYPPDLFRGAAIHEVV